MSQRSVPVLVIAFLMASACARTPANSFTEADATAIQASKDVFTRAVKDTNAGAVADLYVADAIVMPPNGPEIRDRDGIMRWVRSNPPLTTFEIRTAEIEGRDDLAYVYGRYSLVAAPPGMATIADSGKYVEIWRKQADGTWKMTRDIYNSDVPTAAPPAPAANRPASR